MAKNSFAAQVLATIKNDIGSGVVFSAKDVGKVLDVKTYADLKKVPGCLSDLSSRSALIRVARGRFRLPQPGEVKPKKPLDRDKIWAILRMRGTVTCADLVELCGVKKNTAQEYLRFLVKREYVKALPQGRNKLWKYQLIKRDIVAAPKNTLNAEKLRRRRRQQQLTAARALEKAMRNYYKTAVDLHNACELAVTALQPEADSPSSGQKEAPDVI